MIFNKKITLTIYSFFVCIVLFAQKKDEITIRGTVKDFSSGRLIGGASVSLKESTNKVISDEDGTFSIEANAEKNHLIVSFVGYQNFEIEITKEKNPYLIIELKSKSVNISEIEIRGNKKSIFKQTGLYEIVDTLEEANIEGFYALNLFNDNLSNEIWYTPDKKCIEAEVDKTNKYKGNSSLKVKWDKPSGGCTWIGMGFGWNAWQGKDIGALVGKAAIQMYVRSKGDTLKGLPLALALEDYSNVQAYTGFSPAFIEGGKITSNWTKITIPLNAFPIVSNDLDVSNIKQFIIQFDGDGELYFDEITIVRFEGVLKPKYNVTKKSAEINIDGNITTSEWGEKSIVLDGNQNVFLKYDNENIFIAASIEDKNPMINKHDDAEMWNGDAIEISIGTNPEADLNRTRYMFSDYQLGVKVCDNPYVWSWKKKERMADTEIKIKRTNTGYDIEMKIPLKNLDNVQLKENLKYGFEIAIDDGDTSGSRTKQMRWASPQQEGFNLNPALWGLIYLKQ